MDLALLDTDTLSELLKQRNQLVVQRAAAYLQAHSQFVLSSITRYEIMRGLKAKNATAQLAKFDVFCRQSLVLPITEKIFDRAADLWADGRRAGRTCKDADLIIAATAIELGRVLVTGNDRDFSWIAAIRLDNWRTP